MEASEKGESGSPVPPIPSEENVRPRSTSHDLQDKIVWFVGLVFLACFVGAMFGFGALRGWDAQSGWTHNISATSQSRFLSEPFCEEPGVKGRYGHGRTGRWYYWKLPPKDITWYSQFCSWMGYILHQITYWVGLYMLQKSKVQCSPRWIFTIVARLISFCPFREHRRIST